MKPVLGDLTRPELEAKLLELGQKPSHAAAVFSALYKSGARSFDGMKGVPSKVRAALAGAFSLPLPSEPGRKISGKDGTVKLLLKFPGEAPAECVVIPGKGRLSACLSSQSGCACGCVFCATGDMGLKRGLSPWEIVAQFSACRKEAGGTLSSLVFMGMGEPFLNWDNVKKAIRILSDGRGFHFPQGKMTVSTVGIVPVIDELAASDLKIKLAVSVVAADPALRARLVPMEKKYPLRAVLASVRNYCLARRAQVFFEYILFEGVNDGKADAERLLALIRDIPCRLNLIPHNPPGAPAAPPSARAKEFQARLIAGGVRTYLRLEKGSDISAACGQLASGTGGV